MIHGFVKLQATCQEWLRREVGQDIVEYVLIMSLVSIIAVVAVTVAGTSISTFWTAIQNAITAVV